MNREHSFDSRSTELVFLSLGNSEDEPPDIYYRHDHEDHNKIDPRSTELVFLSLGNSEEDPPDTYSSYGIEDHNKIELLSTQIICIEKPTEFDHNEHTVEKTTTKTPTEKRASRLVTVVAVVLFIMCIGLISISFILSSDIDNIGT